MKLTYRGITYNDNASQVKTSTVDQMGTYRGVACHVLQRLARNKRTAQPLKYRGLTID